MQVLFTVKSPLTQKQNILQFRDVCQSQIKVEATGMRENHCIWENVLKNGDASKHDLKASGHSNPQTLI